MATKNKKTSKFKKLFNKSSKLERAILVLAIIEASIFVLGLPFLLSDDISRLLALFVWALATPFIFAIMVLSLFMFKTLDKASMPVRVIIVFNWLAVLVIIFGNVF